MLTVLAQTTPEIALPDIAWFSLSPELFLVGGALMLLVVSALLPRKPAAGSYAIVTVVAALSAGVLSLFLWNDVRNEGAKNLVGDALVLDGYSVFFKVLICVAIAMAALIADGYLRREELDGPELYALLLCVGTGGMLMASANDLVVLFLALETLSIGLYVMAAMHLGRKQSQEAAIKYFVLGSFASAFFLYGIALTYGATGSTNLSDIKSFLQNTYLLENGLLLAGFALLLVGLAFKVAAVPFHMWTPDVYQGAPTPVTGFMAAASKAAAFAALIRLFVVVFGNYVDDWQPLVWLLAVLTLVVGSTLAVVQDDVKRTLAYSSIAHAGYVLVGVTVASDEGTAAALFYLFVYAVLALGTFGVVTVVGGRGDDRHSIDDYRGLGRDKPVLAFVLTVFLLAQAGMPLTSGFMAKWYVITSAAQGEEWVLAVIAMLAAVVAAYLYLRIIGAMYLAETDESIEPRLIPVPFGAGMAIGGAVIFTLVVGIVPQFLIEFARDALPVVLAGN